ncbi:hypothetical protein PVT71_11505 [Salipiger sp. H15]|uniref:Uncharacterized protein n=1 Tax=Alloyangia sp. H15 TaxID=3029062 RepID=A0AAU8AF83_9RHOB
MKMHPLEIVCPECGGLAQFHEPFRFVRVRKFGSTSRRAHMWGRLAVEELFPKEFPWEQPSSDTPSFRYDPKEPGDGYLFNHRGMLECSKCRKIAPTKIIWPDSAYWRWIAEGELLVARNRDHANEIYEFLVGALRSPNRRPSLRHIPSVMLTNKVSSQLAKKILRDLVAS